MQLNELNHRSPLRLFERSVQGGLGAGNLGLVAARAGVGKSGFLTLVALDDLLNGKRVLHVVTGDSVDHVRDFYEEIFSDLAKTSNLEATHEARRKFEANRIIQNVNARTVNATELADTLSMLRREIDFTPAVIVIDGHDFDHAGHDAVAQLLDVARKANTELWMSIRTRRTDGPDDWHVMPEPVAKLADLASVVVLLQPVGAAVRVRLLKDHDRQDIAELPLEFDPRTLLVREG